MPRRCAPTAAGPTPTPCLTRCWPATIRPTIGQPSRWLAKRLLAAWRARLRGQGIFAERETTALGIPRPPLSQTRVQPASEAGGSGSQSCRRAAEHTSELQALIRDTDAVF